MQLRIVRSQDRCPSEPPTEAPVPAGASFVRPTIERRFLPAIETGILSAMPADHRDEAERSETSSTHSASDTTSPSARRHIAGDPARLAAESIQRAKDKFSVVTTLMILAVLVTLTISVAISDVVTAASRPTPAPSPSRTSTRPDAGPTPPTATG